MSRVMPVRCRRVVRSTAALVSVIVSVVAVTGGVANAATLTSLTTEGFAGATTLSNEWYLPSSSVACLTAGSNPAQTPIPGCQSSAIDTPGSGTLRLTGNANNLVGTVSNTTSLPTAKGLDVKFNTYQWSGTTPGADGISFILAATDPKNPAPPATSGPLGGSLGYSAQSGKPGVSYGYLGFGLDVYGNFESSAFGGTGCATTSAVQNSITVRGPGNGAAGYCVQQTAVANGTLDDHAATARPAAVPVEIVVNPGAATTTESGISVGANSWLMQVSSIGGTAQTLTGALPSGSDLTGYGFPASWVDPTTNLPYQLTFGWAASTGSKNEVHEINTLTSTTLNGQLPSYDLAVGDNESGQFIAGNHATVSVTPSLDAAQGDEDQAATVTTTFPVGITPATVTSADYTCATSGQVVTCTSTATDPITHGSSLPAVQIPVAISYAATGNYTIASKVSSNDGNPATVADTVSVSPFGASASSASVSYGNTETLSATGLPASAAGTVSFDSGGTTLCTATLPAMSCATSTALAVASYPVTATYSGDANYATQTATTSFAVTAAPTSVAASVSDASVEYGTADTLIASGLPSGATGTVGFQSGTVTLCTVAIPETSCDTPTTLAPGTYPVTATYSGDTNYAGSSATTTFTVAKASTPFAATVSSASVAYGVADTLSATGLPVGATGTVAFVSGGATLCTATLPATSCQSPTTLGVNSYPVTATYSGDANFATSSATTSFAVTPASTTLTAGVSAASVFYGTADTLSVSGLPAGATGSVTFAAGGTTLCTATLPATTCDTSTTLVPGTYAVTATYSGDTNHASSSDTVTFAVGKAPVSITAAAGSPSVAYGNADTLSVTGLPANATGTVTFASGGTTLCTATLPATACASPAGLAAGTYLVTATYSGDTLNQVASATTTFHVTKAATNITAITGAPSVTYGTSDTLSVSGLQAGVSGTVAFTSGGATLCTATLPATACTNPAGLTAGTYPVTATYSGDPNHTGSTATTTFTVTKATTAISAAAGAPSVAQGTTNFISVTGLPIGATGTITVASNGRTLCTVTLPATSCSSPTTLAPGGYSVIATYSGDANHEGGTATTSFSVTPVVTATVTTTAGTSKPITIPGSTGARSVTIADQPAHGTARIVNGELVYTATPGYVGTDTVTLRVVHADGSISLVTTTVHVEAPESGAAPTATAAADAHAASGTSQLPFTGGNVIAPTVVASMLLATGTSVVWISRRFKRPSD